MRDSVRAAVLGGLPTVAECGGFLYLHRTLDGAEMVGAIDADAHLTKKLQPFGYVTLTARRDNLLCRAGEQTRAHVFHYAVSGDEGADFDAQKPNGRAWACIHANDTLYVGFPHLYFRANQDFAASFVRRSAQKG